MVLSVLQFCFTEVDFTVGLVLQLWLQWHFGLIDMRLWAMHGVSCTQLCSMKLEEHRPRPKCARRVRRANRGRANLISDSRLIEVYIWISVMSIFPERVTRNHP